MIDCRTCGHCRASHPQGKRCDFPQCNCRVFVPDVEPEPTRTA